MRILALVLALVTGALAQSGSTGDHTQAIKDVVRRYVEARESQDPKAVGALFTDNADQLVSTGEWRRGRDQLVKGMLASSQQNAGKRTITVETVRFLGPDVAIADGRYEIAGSAGRAMWSTFVISRRNGAWRIEAIRNMLPTAPAR